MRPIGFLFLMLIGFGVAMAATAGEETPRFVAGRDYKVIDNPLPPSDTGKIRVREFFLYSCPHCYHFDPTLQSWVETLGDDVAFGRSPVMFGGASKTYARIYYTAKKLGVLGRVHDDIFDTIHQQRRPLQRREAIEDFFKAHGVSPQRFNKVYESKAVKQAVAEARQRMLRFGVRAVPSLGVAGRYWISGRMAGSNERMLKIAEYLIEKTRQARKSKGEQ